jgi:hypothetical protein
VPHAEPRQLQALGEPLAKVEYDPADLLPLISRDLGPLNRMMERAGLSELAIYERTRDVFIPTGFQQGADVAFQLVFIRQVHGAMGRRVVRSDILLPAAPPRRLSRTIRTPMLTIFAGHFAGHPPVGMRIVRSEFGSGMAAKSATFRIAA